MSAISEIQVALSEMVSRTVIDNIDFVECIQKLDIHINTEEFTTIDTLNFLLNNEYCISKTLKRLNPDLPNFIIKVNRIFWCPDTDKILIDIEENIYINGVFINLVTSAQPSGKCFIDLNIYIRKSGDVVGIYKCPDLVIEITKNDSGDAGNQCYQRLEKFLNLINIYGMDCYCNMDKVLFMNITKTNRSNSVTWKITKRMCNTLGIKFIAKRGEEIEYDTEGYNNLKEMETHMNSTKVSRGQPNRIYINEGNTVSISTNLIHTKKKLNSNMHDPNTGFAVAVLFVILKLGPDYNIRFIEHNLKEKQLTSQEKFWHCIKKYSDKILFQSDNDLNHDINWDRLDNENIVNEYCKPIDKNKHEKYASIRLHYNIINNEPNIIVMFHNHAGCEKSNIKDPFNGKYYGGGTKTTGIPDLITFESGETTLNKLNKLTVWEAESSKNYKKGIIQIKNDFPAWIEENIMKKLNLNKENTEIVYKLCLSGDKLHNVDVPYDIKYY